MCVHILQSPDTAQMHEPAGDQCLLHVQTILYLADLTTLRFFRRISETVPFLGAALVTQSRNDGPFLSSNGRVVTR